MTAEVSLIAPTCIPFLLSTYRFIFNLTAPSAKVDLKPMSKVSDSSSKLISKTKCNSSLLVLESDNPLETITEQSANFDLLILGTPEKDNWLNVLFGGGRDRFVHNSVCSVLRLTIK